jgi:hypothetical protein
MGCECHLLAFGKQLGMDYLYPTPVVLNAGYAKTSYISQNETQGPLEP